MRVNYRIARTVERLTNAGPRADCAAREWQARLLAALAQPLAEREAAPGETRGTGYHASRRAGVLIPIVGAGDPYIYFTERSHSLRHHPGQISFPGGSVETGDPSVQAAALREAEEEIGLDPARVTIIGELPAYRTVTGFVISPFVGWVEPAAPVAADGIEVARLFGVPLVHALDPRRFHRQQVPRGGRNYTVYSIDYNGNHIWGATAGMLYGLAQRLRVVERRGSA